MYRSLFGLIEDPFNLTPDPRYLFLSRSHQEAYDHLRYGIDQRKGFIEVIGGIGTGKTTLCKALLNDLDPRVRTAYVFNPSISEIELLHMINEEFGLDGKGRTKKEQIDSLNQFLIQEHARNGNAVLIIDESQNLDPKVLEEIRMLSNLETDQEKLIQIVLVGQPELHELLNTPSLQQLNERISVRAFLKPLSKTDTRAYIHHRLAIAGSKGGIHFTEGALKQIYRHSQGNPRRINNICDRALLIAYTHNSFRIRKSYITRAVNEIEGTLVMPGIQKKERFLWLRFILIFFLAFSIAFGIGWFLRTKLPSLLGEAQKAPITHEKVQTDNPPAHVEESTSFDVDAVPETKSAFEKAERSTGKEPRPKAPLDKKEEVLASLKEIFQLFDLPFPSIDLKTFYMEKLNLSDVAQIARLGGLEALPWTLNTDQLSSFIVPCLLEVYSGDFNGRRYIVMKKMMDEVLVASDPEMGEVLYPKGEIERIWSGNCLLFYPRPAEGTAMILREGIRNPRIKRLQEQLAFLDYYHGDATGEFDTTTKRSVLKFQRDFALQPDGVVGPKTKILLFQLTEKSLDRDIR